MNTVIECRACPSCGHERTRNLLPPGTTVDTTLDLLLRRHRIEEFDDVDLSPFFAPVFAICERCALIFFRTRPHPEAAKRYYARLFHRIEVPLPYDSLPISQRFLERRSRIAQELLATLASRGLLADVKSVLYVRCNAGEGPKILRDDYGIGEVYALEYLPSLIRHAKEVLGLDRVEPLLVPDFENPFPRRKFDLVVCDEAFGHAFDPLRTAEYLKTLLCDGGRVVLFNEKDHTQILGAPKLFPHGMNFFHPQLYTRKSLRLSLELRGYEVEELPHPAIGKPGSRKNTKILYVARPSASSAPPLASDEVEKMAAAFRRWWARHRWYRRGRRVRNLFRRREIPAGWGGEARR